MNVGLLDTVVLERDISEYRLKRGDLGAVVEVYDPDGIEVEFVTGTGRTRALLTLTKDRVRPLRESDILSVRSEHAA